MKKNILLDRQGLTATLTLNQPENLNALDEAMGHDFRASLNEIKNDSKIRALIITGAGRAFSSGGNLDMIEAKIAKPRDVNKQELKNFYQLFLGVRDLPIPVIAAINGPAIGAGFCLALACDFRLAARTAKMGANFAKIGLAPGMGGTYLISHLAGVTRATEILMLAETFSADQAYQYGLLQNVHEPEVLLAHCQQLADKLTQNGPIALRMIKRGLQKAPQSTLEELFDYDSNCQAESFATEDIKEGITAIREKRLPRFTGK